MFIADLDLKCEFRNDIYITLGRLFIIFSKHQLEYTLLYDEYEKTLKFEVMNLTEIKKDEEVKAEILDTIIGGWTNFFGTISDNNVIKIESE